MCKCFFKLETLLNLKFKGVCMKKLLVVLLVLSMATMANAALQITVGANNATDVTEMTLNPSDNVTLGIYTSDIMGFGKGDWNGSALVVSGPAGLLSAANAVSLYPNEPGIAIFQSASVDLGFPTTLQGPGFTFTFTGADINPGQIINSIAFHCEGAGDVTIQLLGSQQFLADGSDTVVLDTLVIHQVPEPITLGLLGLGGLFLRRRK
jgi:hypothetical protein